VLRKIVDTQPLVELLVIQPTPFCNINCDYCYLPDRNSRKRITLPILRKTIENVFVNKMVGKRLSIVWHAGEPLVLPIVFYEEAFEAISSLAIGKKKITHSIQSNGILINNEWCRFIKEHDINLGLSIDGPSFIHDAHRKTRRGLGTHKQVMRGVEILQKQGVDFHVISVITDCSLDYPDEIFNFFLENGIRRVGFNIEEIEGANQTSTLVGNSVDERIKKFLQRLYELQKNAKGLVKIREFENAFRAITHGTDADAHDISSRNDQVRPYKIISVDCDGNFSTFSPELLGLKNDRYGDFCFGNVQTNALPEMTSSSKFNRVFRDIQAGVKLCSETCGYYFLCGGGAPSNKYYENGTFASTETMYCRYTIKMPVDIVLADLEEALAINQITEAVAE
jgi:uncharacterized protein